MAEDLPLMIVAAAALTRADGRVLVQQRPPGKPSAGLWEFPGGKVEPGESPEAALARELVEEIGVDIDPLALTPLSFASMRAGGGHLLLLLHVVRRWSGKPRALEAAALRWEAPAALAGLPMPPADYPLAAALVRYLKLEARPGIEPGCKDLQSSASPLRHRAPIA